MVSSIRINAINRLRATLNAEVDEVNAVQETNAQTFRNRQEARKMAEQLLSRLGKAGIQYKLSDIDNTINSKADVPDVVNELKKVGFAPFSVQWPVSKRLKHAVFMSDRGKMPILVREPNQGWGTSIVLLGTSVARFKHVTKKLSHLLTGQCMLDVVAVEDGVMSLALHCKLKPGVQASTVNADNSTFMRPGPKGLEPIEDIKINSLSQSIAQIGFEKTNVPKRYLSKNLKVYMDCKDHPQFITIIDSMY